MSKPIVLGIGGAVVGVVVAFAAFTFLMGGGGDEVAAAPPTEPVNVPGKVGPHITLGDRVFNLLPDAAGKQVYLKLQTVIEFETYDPDWEYVLNGCGHGDDDHAARFVPTDEFPAAGLMVSAAPGGSSNPTEAASSGGPAVDPCQAQQDALLADFEHEIGSGVSVIEDAVTSIVTGHTAAEIATPEGKEALKAEIKAAVDGLIHEPHVHRVLFLNFITQ